MNRIWLAGMWRGNKEVLEKSIGSIYQHFNGIVAVIDSRAKKEDVEWLNSIKGVGKIIVKDWVNDHAHTSNEVLLSGAMETYDYFVWIDETDQLTDYFISQLKDFVISLYNHDVGAVYLDRPFVLRYHDALRVVCSPHWTFSNIIGKSIDFTSGGKFPKENIIHNLRNRDKESNDKSCLLHPSKYFWCYGLSNHTQLLYGKYGQDKVNFHENRRQQMRIYAKLKLGINNTLEDLEKYFMSCCIRGFDYDKNFIDWVEEEVSMIDFFRYKILKQDLMTEIVPNRFAWSLKHYLETRDSIQIPIVKEGIMYKYARELNMEPPQ